MFCLSFSRTRSSIGQYGLHEVEGKLHFSAELGDSIVPWKCAIVVKLEYRKIKQQLGAFVTCQLGQSDLNRQMDFSSRVHTYIYIYI